MPPRPLMAPPIRLDGVRDPQAGRWLRSADAVFVVSGILLLSGVLIYFVVGNAEPDAIALEDGNPIGRLSWYPFYFAALIALMARMGKVARGALSAWPIFALLALSLISTIWSVLPDVTSRRAIAVIFTVLFGFYLAVRGPWISTLRLIGIGLAIVAVIHLLIILLSPGTGIDHETHAGAWKGMSPEKNALGGDMARAGLILTMLTHVDPGNRRKWLAATALAWLLVLGSTSTTAFVALALPTGLFALFLIGRHSPVRALITVYAGGSLLAAIGAGVLLFPEAAVGLFGKDLTFTGRTGIWEACLQAISERPLTGYGLGAFWSEPYGPSYAVRNSVEWTVPSAHNSWLEIGLALGWPGMILLGLIVSFALARALWRTFSQANPWLFLALAQQLMFSFSESVVFWHPNITTTALSMFFVALAFLPAEATRLDPER